LDARVGILLIFIGIRVAVPALALSSRKMADDFGHTTLRWMSPRLTLAVAGLYIVLAIALIVAGSLADDDPDS
jgi:hypothetical protein